MKLISIDIETTGLDPSWCSILEIGAVIFDPDPLLAKEGKVNEAGRRPATFERLITHSRIQGEPYALQMNAGIIAEIAGVEQTHIPIVDATTAVTDLRDFIDDNSDGEVLTVVGKNYDAFDKRFLERLPGWDIHTRNRLSRRTLDVGSLYFDPQDGEVVSLGTCLEKIGCPGLVTHRALDDALAVMTAVTRFFN